MSKLVLGVVGASSMIAKELVEWMSKWRCQEADVHFYDTKEHVGYVQCCCDHFMPIQEMKDEVVSELDIVVFCEETLRYQFASKCKKTSFVINLCSYQPGETLIVPHINSDTVTQEDGHLFLPDATYMMLATILNVVQKLSPLEAIDVTSLHSVAECGHMGCEDLQKQLQAFAQKQDLESKLFPLQDSFQNLPLLFQALPQTSPFLKDGRTQEEAFLMEHLNKLCEPCKIAITCVRITAIRGMAMSITMHLQDDISQDTFMDAISSSPACVCIDDIEHDMYPICGDVIHDYRVFIGRMRKLDSHCFQAWAVCDELSIRCAATVQLILYLAHNFYVS